MWLVDSLMIIIVKSGFEGPWVFKGFNHCSKVSNIYKIENYWKCSISLCSASVNSVIIGCNVRCYLKMVPC